MLGLVNSNEQMIPFIGSHSPIKASDALLILDVVLQASVEYLTLLMIDSTVGISFRGSK